MAIIELGNWERQRQLKQRESGKGKRKGAPGIGNSMITPEKFRTRNSQLSSTLSCKPIQDTGAS
jgi:hypothetical protein